jgi:multidrug transporter EmrE-like cation transporter
MTAPTVHWIPIAFATGMAMIDSLAFSILKKISLKELGMMFLPLSMLIYSSQPVIFLQALKFENMAIVNLLWNMMSNILVTFTGLVLLQEKVGLFKGIGIALSFVAIFLMTYEDGESELVTALAKLFGSSSKA